MNEAAALQFPDRSLEPVPSMDFRDALSKASTAVTIVATNGPAGLAGVTCSAVCSVCDEPPTVLLCVNRKGYATGVIKQNQVLSVNWLAADQAAISQKFAGVGAVPMAQRFDDKGWDVLVTGAPCRMDAVFSFDCAISNVVDVGSHSVIFAKVVAKAHLEERPPLIYHRRQYTTTQSIAGHT